MLTQERAVGTSIAQTYVTNVYYGRGVLRSQTDANGNKTDLRYDANWRLQKRVYPSKFTPGSVNESDFNEYTYDKNGNVVLERKRNGATIANTYDANNRLTFKDLSDNTYSGDITYDYDLRGLTLSSCFGSTDLCVTSGEGETNEFDGMGNLALRTSRMAGVSRPLEYLYDLEGNRQRVTHPDAWFFEYGFDGLNRMNSLAESASASPTAGTSNLLTISYRPSGGRENIVRTGGATTTIEPNNALRLKKFTQDFALTANDLANEFGYNHAGQVVALSQSNTQYNYTEAQNRVGAYTPNGLNQYTSIDGGPTMAYDGNGNLTSDGEGRSYTYDMENHLVATSGSASSTLVYDVLGRLAQISVNGTTTQFHYDGDALVGEYVAGALTRRYVHGDQVDEPLVQYSGTNVSPSNRRYLHGDHQGSVIAQSDNAGAAVVKNAYDPYGIPATTNDGRFGYTGQTWLKELGLNYYKARVYSPKLGRFLQTDPIFYEDDMNMYAYVGNDPANKTDPTGRFWDTAADTVDVLYNAGQVIGGVVAFAVGIATGDDALANVSADGLRDARVDMGAAAAAVVIPGVSSGMLRTAEKGLEAASKTQKVGATADAARVAEQRAARAERREAQSRSGPDGARDSRGNQQKPSGTGDRYQGRKEANKGPAGDRPAGPDRSNNRERNVGIDEEHSRRPKGGFR